MVLREFGGLLHAVMSGALMNYARCQPKTDEPKDSGGKLQTNQTIKTKPKRNTNQVPEWAKEWGEDIEWVSLDEGLKLSKNYFKPLMVIVEKRNCPKCEILRSQVCLSDEFVEASKDFIMVVVDQSDLDPKEGLFKPDGEYTPRALFFHPDGPFLSRYTNDFLKTPNKYFYRSPKNLVRVMNKAKFYFLDQ